jgi:acyl-CoA thioester hydrolase
MRVHTAEFRVNIYDVDAWGDARTNAIIRFMQQAASDASTAAGFDIEWYAQARTLWVIRRTIVQYAAPARYDDTLEVRTWVADMRRVRSQREYEVCRAADRALIARGSTDWVYVDLTRGAPAQPPPEMLQRLMPDVGAQPRPPRLAGDPPPTAVCTPRRVELADLDSVAHVNNAQYAVYVEQAVYDALAARGWHVQPAQGAAPVRVVQHDLEYYAEAQYGDRLTAAVWLVSADSSGFVSRCSLTRGSTRVLQAATVWQWSEGGCPAALRAAAEALALSA